LKLFSFFITLFESIANRRNKIPAFNVKIMLHGYDMAFYYCAYEFRAYTMWSTLTSRHNFPSIVHGICTVSSTCIIELRIVVGILGIIKLLVQLFIKLQKMLFVMR